MPQWKTPQDNYDANRLLTEQDMWEYSPYLRAIAKGTILEIGVCGGVSTAAFLCGLEQHGGHLYSIDIDPKCETLFDHAQWTFINSDSREYGWRAELPLDILFIDGDHHYDTVMSDLQTYSPFVKPGGLILMHDVGPDARNFDWRTQRWTDGRPEEHQYPPYDPLHAMVNFLLEGTCEYEATIPGQFGLGVIKRGSD